MQKGIDATTKQEDPNVIVKKIHHSCRQSGSQPCYHAEVLVLGAEY